MYRLRLLGGLELEGPSGPLSGRVVQRRQLALLALLAASLGGGLSRDKLLGYLWPESNEERARHRLSDTLHVIRKALGEGAVLVSGELLRLNPELVWTDVCEMEAALENGEPAVAVGAYGGPFLDGVHLGEALEFERWVEGERVRYAGLYARALEALACEAEDSGDYGKAAEWWKRLAAQDPYDSRLVVRVMEALAAAGDAANALQQAHLHEQLLREELEVEPAAEVLETAERLRGAGYRERQPLRQLAPTAVGAAVRVSEISSGRRLTWRTGLGVSAVTAVVVVAIVAGLRVLGGPEPGEVVDWNRVAVLPFTVRGSDGLAYLGEGMVDLLSTTLEGAGELTTVAPQALLSFVRRTGGVMGPEEAGRLARHFGAGLYIMGSVVALGDETRVNATLYNVDGSVVARLQTQTAGGSHLHELVDDLSRQLLATGVGGPGTRLSRLAALTTQSLPALREYLRGEKAFRLNQNAEAAAAYQRAVAADSTFALAYYRLAVVGGLYFFADVDARGAIQRALQYKDRLAERERQLLEAYDAFLRHDPAEAESQFLHIVAIYPSDVEAWFALAKVLLWFFPALDPSISEISATAERILALDPDHVEGMYSLSWVAGMEGKYDEARALLERKLELAPDADLAPLHRTGLAYARGDRAEQERILAELRGAGENVVYFAVEDVIKASDDWAGAIEVAELLIERSRSEWDQQVGSSQAAHLYLALGKWGAAKAELERAEALLPDDQALKIRAALAASSFLPVPRCELEELRGRVEHDLRTSVYDQVDPPYLAGLLSVRLEDYESAERHARWLDAYAEAPEEGPHSVYRAAMARDLALSLRAFAARQAGRPSEAQALLDQTKPEAWWGVIWWARGLHLLTTRALERYLTGEVLQELGRDEEALIWYEALSWRPFDLVYRVPAHFRQAEIYERLGDQEAAAHHYARVIELWKDCDPELRPLVEAAERALERLTGE